MDITPIETRYAGCRFRSRLEARWAVFFDTLGVEWQYEPQGYLVNDKPYLPDFYLPKLRSFVEVKGDAKGLDLDLMAAIPGHVDDVMHVLILGQVPNVELGEVPTHSMFTLGYDFRQNNVNHEMVREASLAILKLDEADQKKVWTFIRHESQHARLMSLCHRFFPVLSQDGFWPMSVGPANLSFTAEDVLAPAPLKVFMVRREIEAAYEAARSARFEHGESGA